MQRSAGTHRTEHWAHARSALPTAGRPCVQSFGSRGTVILPVSVLSASRISRQTRMSVLLVSFGSCFRAHGYGQRKQIDKTFGVLGVVAAHGKVGRVRAIKGERRNALSNIEVALQEFQADDASDALLCDVEKSVEGFAERREPQAVVNQFGVAQ